MAPLTVIEELDILRDLLPGLLPRGIPPVMHQFVLPRTPKTFHRGIVIAVASPTHGRDQAELMLMVLGTILRAAIRVVDQAWSWALCPYGHEQGLSHQVRRHPDDRMADHFTGVEILQASQIQPPFCGRHIGDVGDPDLVRLRGGNVWAKTFSATGNA